MRRLEFIALPRRVQVSFVQLFCGITGQRYTIAVVNIDGILDRVLAAMDQNTWRKCEQVLVCKKFGRTSAPVATQVKSLLDREPEACWLPSFNVWHVVYEMA